MVVDTVEQGQACIEYLRAQNIGRASFMVLEKLTNTRGMEPIQTPEGVPRLFDLIKPKDPRFAAAFYKGVGNTLVANDMDQATRIAFGQRRWRVVTLAGHLIDTSGTMSGGGSQPTRGGMSSKLPAEAVRPEVLAQYERESDDAAKELERVIQEAREAEAEYIRLKGLGPTLDMSYEKLGMEIETNKKKITDSERRFRELKFAVRFTFVYRRSRTLQVAKQARRRRYGSYCQVRRGDCCDAGRARDAARKGRRG